MSVAICCFSDSLVGVPLCHCKFCLFLFILTKLSSKVSIFVLSIYKLSATATAICATYCTNWENFSCQFHLHKHSASVYDCQWVWFFPRGGVQFHSFASYMLPCQTPFCQTAPQLPSVTQQQNLTEYWWEGSTSTAISPTSICLWCHGPT